MALIFVFFLFFLQSWFPARRLWPQLFLPTFSHTVLVSSLWLLLRNAVLRAVQHAMLPRVRGSLRCFPFSLLLHSAPRSARGFFFAFFAALFLPFCVWFFFCFCCARYIFFLYFFCFVQVNLLHFYFSQAEKSCLYRACETSVSRAGKGRTTSGGRRLCDERSGDRPALAGFRADPASSSFFCIT